MFLKASAESPVFQRPVSEVRRQKQATNISACEAGASIKPGRLYAIACSAGWFVFSANFRDTQEI